MARPLPGLVEVAHQAGKKCAFFYNWEQLRDLSRPGHLEYSFFYNNGENNGRVDPDADDPIFEAAARTLAQRQFDFTFVYFGSVDVAGHAYGWMSDHYLTQLERVDAAFGRLVDALPADITILVQSDHGGHERGHGTDLPEDMTIPWMIAGPGIRANYEIETAVTLLDSAPTLAKLLNISAPPQWEGRCVHEIWENEIKEDGGQWQINSL
jgi:phosphopentomutase